jgi:alkanesulfonate monooxygenase SsuD/methylene tetrahydromethanopterin reductase-like flavin-dependent oxidoreductase (luciferase family)
MDVGVHLPLMQFGDDEISPKRLGEAVDAARECGFAAVSANDHFVFSTPWLDGPTALASVIDRSGQMTLATTLALAVLRGPVPLAKALAALDVLSGGRLMRRSGRVPPSATTTRSASTSTSAESGWTRRSSRSARS